MTWNICLGSSICSSDKNDNVEMLKKECSVSGRSIVLCSTGSTLVA